MAPSATYESPLSRHVELTLQYIHLLMPLMRRCSFSYCAHALWLLIIYTYAPAATISFISLASLIAFYIAYFASWYYFFQSFSICLRAPHINYTKSLEVYRLSAQSYMCFLIYMTIDFLIWYANAENIGTLFTFIIIHLYCIYAWLFTLIYHYLLKSRILIYSEYTRKVWR